jgi:hypothetical protein
MKYQKGESGNLSGKPKGILHKKTIEHNRINSAIELIEGYIANDNAEPLIRIQAAAVMLSYMIHKGG